MKNEKQFVIDTFKEVYGVTDLAEESFISDDDANQVDDEKVKALFKKYDGDKLKTTKTASFNDGAKAREAKVKTDIEKALKDKFGITETDFTGDDLDTLVDYIAETRKPGKGAITEDELLKHPAVVRLKNQHQTELQAKDTEYNQKLTAKEQEDSKKQLFSRLSTKARAKLTEKNPILPEDEDKKSRRLKKDLDDELAAFGWMEVDGNPIPLDDTGAQLQNSNGVLLSADDIIEQVINENFEFAAAQPRSSAGAGKKDPIKPGQQQQPDKEAYTGTVPDSNEEYLKLLSPKSGLTVEQRASLMRQYKKKKGL